MTRVIFMGTPEFAVPPLQRLLGDYEIVAVVTQPDRKAGRGRKLVASPVKQVALTHGLPVLQPPTLREPEVVAQLARLSPQVILVAAYGQILRRQVLTIPPHGCLNVHASLLPRYRGAAPITAAILDGEEETGVTIMLMDAGMDTGPILTQARLPIAPEDTTASLSEKLSRLGADLLADTLPRWLKGEITPRPQDERQATHAPSIAKEDGCVDWTRPAVEIERQVRAYQPWPGAYTWWRGQRLKILRAGVWPDWQGREKPGTVLCLPQGLTVSTGRGALLLQEVQLAGRRAMSAAEFECGQRELEGVVLGGGEGTGRR